MNATAPTADPTVRLDDWAVLTPGTSVTDALAALQSTGRRTAVVEHRHGYPIGVITLDALRGRSGAVPQPADRISDVMDWECVHCDPGADAHATLQAYHEAAWTSVRRRQPAAASARGGRGATR